MIKLFNRYLKLYFSDGQGEAYDLSDLAFTFDVTKNLLSNPLSCDFKIYNMPLEVYNKAKNDFKYIILEAGYEDINGVIFKGDIITMRRTQEPPNTIIDIVAATGFRALYTSTLSLTVDSDMTIEAVIMEIFNKMKANGVTDINTTNLKNKTLKIERSLSFVSDAREALDKLSTLFGISWRVEDNVLVVSDDTNNTNVYNLGPGTGLIGYPEQTLEGIHVKSLIIPTLKPNMYIKLDSSIINTIEYDIRLRERDKAIELDDKGLYRILSITCVGSSRENDYYMDMVCVADGYDLPMAYSLTGRSIT